MMHLFRIVLWFLGVGILPLQVPGVPPPRALRRFFHVELGALYGAADVERVLSLFLALMRGADLRQVPLDVGVAAPDPQTSAVRMQYPAQYKAECIWRIVYPGLRLPMPLMPAAGYLLQIAQGTSVARHVSGDCGTVKTLLHTVTVLTPTGYS